MKGKIWSQIMFTKDSGQSYSVRNWIILIILLSSCMGGVKNENAVSKQVPPSQKTEVTSALNSVVIYILTPDGRADDSIYYQPDDHSGKYANYIKGYPISDTACGDFNGDGKQEIATIRNIVYYNNLDDFSINMEACQCVIEFSDEGIDSLIIERCTEGAYKNEGDLNDDGKDEIGILPGWFSGGCRQYQVYTYRNNEWIEICDPIENSYNMREAGVVLIEKDKKKGYAVIRQSVDSFMSDPENNISFEYYQGSSCAWSNVVERTIKLN